MKRIIMSVLAAIMAIFVAGCKEEVNVEKITKVATVVGRTAGYACELSKTKQEVKDAIAKVLDITSTIVPTNGQTFVEAWTPVINTEIAKLVEAKKLNETTAQVAKIALGYACEGIDYVFVKYPKAKEAKDLTTAAVTGFIAGYKSVVTFAAGVDKPEIDEEALKYLKEKMAK